MGRQPIMRATSTVVAIFLISCGGSGSDPAAIDSGPGADGRADDQADAMPPGEPDAGPVAATALCQELTTMLCAAEQACCNDSAKKHASEAECFANQNPACLEDLQGPAGDSRTGYDPAIARAELDELAGRLASCDTDIGPWFVSHQGLLRIYQGTVSSGGDCSPSSASDTGPVLSCEAPSVCQLTALPLSGTCGAPRQSGDSCVTEIECADGLRCNPPESLSGRCGARLADDSSCDVNGDCESLICEDGTCVPATAYRVYCFDVN